jgi:hypothetical protein
VWGVAKSTIGVVVNLHRPTAPADVHCTALRRVGSPYSKCKHPIRSSRFQKKNPKYNHTGVAERFGYPKVHQSNQTDLDMALD